MADDIVTRLRGQRTNGRICEEAADEIERLRGLIDNINHVIHTKEPVNPWMHDRVIVQQTKQWPKLWAAIQKACTQCRKGNDNA